MPEVKTVQFLNTAQGQQQKVLALHTLMAAGWAVVSETITPGHFKGGKACWLTGSGLVCCGPLGAPLGLTAGQTEGIITVTLTREERWAAKEQVEKALKPLRDSQSDYQRASAELERATANFSSCLQAVAQLQGFEREGEEKDLANALAKLIDERKSAAKARQQFLQVLSPIQTAYAYAGSVGDEVSTAPFAIDDELGKLTVEGQWDAKRLDQESALFRTQEPVIRAAHSWHEASDKRNSALQRVNEADRQLVEARAAADAAPPDRAEKAAKKVRSAEQERTKRQVDSDKWAAELAKREGVLREALATRNEFVSQLSS